MENPGKEGYSKMDNSHGWLKLFSVLVITLEIISSFALQNGRIVPAENLQNSLVGNVPAMAVAVMLAAFWKKGDEFVVWTPRILSILLILFLAVFSLDVLGRHLGFWGTAFGLLFHNLPPLFLLLVLWVSWRHEIIGGIFFTLAAVLWVAWAFTRFHMDLRFFSVFSKIACPALLTGAFFLARCFEKRRNKHPLKGGKEFIAFG